MFARHLKPVLVSQLNMVTNTATLAKREKKAAFWNPFEALPVQRGTRRRALQPILVSRQFVGADPATLAKRGKKAPKTP